MINLFDSHVHSNNSFDGHSSITFICETAVARGLSGIAITDHCDVNIADVNIADVNAADANSTDIETLKLRVAQSVFEAGIAKNVFKNQLAVAVGIELGQPLEAPEVARSILTSFNFDVIIAALHNLPGEQDYYSLDFTQVPDIHALLERYFEELMRIVSWGKFDILAHITYPLRYVQGRYNIPVDAARLAEFENALLKALAQSGKALELNIAGLRFDGGQTMPALDALRRFREYGGEHVTLGSDAHRAEHVGANLKQGMQLLEAAGYSHFTFYQGRQARKLKII